VRLPRPYPPPEAKVTWSAPGGTPDSGTGTIGFETRFSEPGEVSITLEVCNQSGCTTAVQTLEPGCVSDPSPTFTAHITDLDKLLYVTAIGDIGHQGIRDRSYVYVRQDDSGDSLVLPVYAPTDMALEAVVFKDIRVPGFSPNQYGLFFRVSCQVTLTLDHIKTVVPKIGSVAAEIPTVESHRGAWREARPAIQFKAGELLGYTPAEYPGFDFVVGNTAVTNLVVPAGANTLHTVCPYDFYGGEMRREYYVLLARQGTVPVEEATCGSVNRNKPGTIAGLWFRKDLVELSFHELGQAGAEYIDTPALQREGLGTYIGIASTLNNPHQVKIGSLGRELHISPPDPADRPVYPESVTVGETVCYSGRASAGYTPQFPVMMFKLLSETELAVLLVPSGGCPTEFPEAGYTLYARYEGAVPTD